MNRSAPALLALALLAGCGSSGSTSSFAQPPVKSFRGGPCRTTAPAVLRIGRDARKLGKASSPPRDVRDRLKQDQDLLRAAQPDFDAASKPAIDALVIEVGAVRLRSDTNTYAASLGTALSKAYVAAVAACTAPASGGAG